MKRISLGISRRAAVSLLVIVAFVVAVVFSPQYHPRASGKTFLFSWNHKEQDIADGTLYIWVTVEHVGDNYSFIVKINDNDSLCWGDDEFVICTDTNNDSKIDMPFMLLNDNTTRKNAAVSPDGEIIYPKIAPIPSPYHTVTYGPEGYTYHVSLPCKYFGSKLVFLAFFDSEADVPRHYVKQFFELGDV